VFWDSPEMVAIIECESNFIHYKTDGTVLQGRVTPRDTGVAQINRDYHEESAEEMGYDLDDVYGNLGFARALFEADGKQAWVCSRQVALQR
jgi:hypothetical protein